MSKLRDKLIAKSTIKDTDVLTNSVFFTEKDMIKTDVPMINVALSANLKGGFVPGLTIWAGPSKHFKTAFSLVMAKAYMDKYPDAVMLFYDSEFGAPQKYFRNMKIDTDRVVHTPIMNIEELMFDLVQQLDNIDRGDHVIIVLDSLGNLASKKEATDALEGHSAQDMSRARAIKSFFRIVTPYLTKKNIPFVAINHIYMEQGKKYPRAIVSGGQGPYLAADNIFIISRSQETEGSGADTELVGWNFTITVEKSRYVKEKSKIPIEVLFEGGISPWSGLLELALESGHVVSEKKGYYKKIDPSTGEIIDKSYRAKATNNGEFWLPILGDPRFQKYIEATYALPEGALISNEDDLAELYRDDEEA
jgi:RecA/RadA recombinase